MSNKPWDARIAATIVSPFANSIYVQPNHFTLLRLIVGLAGSVHQLYTHTANVDLEFVLDGPTGSALLILL